jgi:hypothetical protein
LDHWRNYICTKMVCCDVCDFFIVSFRR